MEEAITDMEDTGEKGPHLKSTVRVFLNGVVSRDECGPF